MAPDSRRTGFIAAAAILAGALLFFALAPASPTNEAGKVHVITIQSMRFEPARVEISAGDSVTWVNNDIFVHAVKSTDAKNPWQSKDLKTHDSWTKKFNQGGAYLCPYHPTMTGEVVAAEK